MSAYAGLTRTTSQIQCRICSNTSTNKDELIIPCLCNGPLEYVHRECLNNLRSLNIDGDGYRYCEVCRFEYNLKKIVVHKGITKTKTILFRLLVIFDVILINIISQGIIIGIKYLIELLDAEKHNIKNIYPASMNPFLVYYISGLILFLFLMGIFGRIWQFSNRGKDNNLTGVINIPWFTYEILKMGGCCSEDERHHSGLRGGGDDCGHICIIPAVILGVLVVIATFVLIMISDIFLGIIQVFPMLKQLIYYHGEHLRLIQEERIDFVKDFNGRKYELGNIIYATPTYGSTSVVYTQPTYATTPQIHYVQYPYQAHY